MRPGLRACSRFAPDANWRASYRARMTPGASRGILRWAKPAGIAAALLMSGCGAQPAGLGTSIGTGSAQYHGRPTPPPVASPPPGRTEAVSAGLGENGRTIRLRQGETLSLTLPRAGDRELDSSMVRSSDSAVLALEPLAAGRPGGILVIDFRALRPGTAVVTVGGPLSFRMVVEVVAG